MNSGGKQKTIAGIALPLLGLAILSTGVGYALRPSDPPHPAPPAEERSPAASDPLATATVAEASAPRSHADFIAGVLAAAGGAPSVDEVFASKGFDRYEKLALFLVTASSADCEEIYTRWQEADDLKHHCMDAILLRWTEIDPEAAAKMNASAGVWAWAKTDPEAAFAHGLAHGSSVAALRAIGQTDGQRGLDLLREHPEAGSSSSWEGIASGLAKTNRRAGVEFALEKAIDLDGMMKTWAALEPENALEFTLGLEDPRQRRVALKELLSKFGETDPTRAAQIIDDLPPSEMRRQFRTDLLNDLATRDLESALSMAESIARPAERTAALHKIAEQIALADPDRAIDLLTGGDADPSGYDYSGDLVRTLGELRPEACLTHGIEPHRVACDWVTRDPEGASTWIAEQPPSANRDEMVQGLIDSITENSPDPDFPAATAWAGTLDPNTHEDAFQVIFARWMASDREAALAALGDPDVPASVRNTFSPSPSPSPEP